MERPKHNGGQQIIVGLFIVVTFIVTFGFLTFIGSSSFFGGSGEIKTLFKDVRGLNVGAPVFMSGIQIGRISSKSFPSPEQLASIQKDFPEQEPIVVSFTIENEFLPRIREDSQAAITTVGMLGDKVVVISQGSESSPKIGKNAYVPAKVEKEFSEYFAKGGNLVEDLSESAIELKNLLKEFNNSGKLDRVISNVEKISNNLAKTTEPLAAELGPATKSLRNILAKIEKGEGTLGSLINDPSLHEDLRVLLGGAQRSTAVRLLIRQAISAGEKKGDEPAKK